MSDGQNPGPSGLTICDGCSENVAGWTTYSMFNLCPSCLPPPDQRDLLSNLAQLAETGLEEEQDPIESQLAAFEAIYAQDHDPNYPYTFIEQTLPTQPQGPQTQQEAARHALLGAALNKLYPNVQAMPDDEELVNQLVENLEDTGSSSRSSGYRTSPGSNRSPGYSSSPIPRSSTGSSWNPGQSSSLRSSSPAHSSSSRSSRSPGQISSPRPSNLPGTSRSPGHSSSSRSSNLPGTSRSPGQVSSPRPSNLPGTSRSPGDSSSPRSPFNLPRMLSPFQSSTGSSSSNYGSPKMKKPKLTPGSSGFTPALDPECSPYYTASTFYKHNSPDSMPSTSGTDPRNAPTKSPAGNAEAVTEAMESFKDINEYERGLLLNFMRVYKEELNPEAEAWELASYGYKKLKNLATERQIEAFEAADFIDEELHDQPSTPPEQRYTYGDPTSPYYGPRNKSPPGFPVPVSFAPRPTRWVNPNLLLPAYPRAQWLEAQNTDPNYVFRSPGGTLHFNPAQRKFAKDH